MSKLSKTFLLIGAILSLIVAVTMVICGIVFLAFSAPAVKEYIIELLEQAEIHTDIPGTPAEQAASIQTIFMSIGIVFMIWAVVCVISAVVAFVGRNKQTNGLLVANIVLGLFSGEFNTAGGILGLIANARIERNNRRNNVVDNQ